MQGIIVDHAKLDDTEFIAEIIEDWQYTGLKLVPPEWYEETGSVSIGSDSEEV